MGSLDHGYVGCVAVAAGQILAMNVWQNKCIMTEYIGGCYVDWPLILSVINDASVNNELFGFRGLYSYDRSPKALAVAKFLWAVGAEMSMKYHVDGSAPDSYSTILAFYSYVFGGRAQLLDYSENKILAMLSEDLPVHVAGDNSNVGQGHEWVIDGVCKQQRIVEKCVFSGVVVDSKSEFRTLFHCNFGYNGKRDGYYYSKVFDLEKGSEVHDPRGDLLPGYNEDVQFADKNYSKRNRIITYTIGR